MFAQERFQSISDLLSRHQKLSVRELQETLQVSPATLRRDLGEMESAGKLIRMRGAVVHPNYFRGEPTLDQKRRAAATAKRAIAQAAAELVPPGSSVFLDGGTTCLEIGRILLARPDLTLLTHSLPLAALAYGGSARLICLGGEVRAISGVLIGGLAMDWMRGLKADFSFLGASGLSEDGASTTELSEAGMKQELMRRAPRTILVADSKKWAAPSLVRFAAWTEFSTWITDESLRPTAAQAIRDQGVEVLTVKTGK